MCVLMHLVLIAYGKTSRNYLAGIEALIWPETFIYVHILRSRVAMALSRLRTCAGSPEP